MTNIKTNFFRAIRKSSNIFRRLSLKSTALFTKIEKRSNRIINGLELQELQNNIELYEKILYDTLPEITPIHPAMPKVGRKPTVNLFLPSLRQSSFFGGTATALMAAAMAAQHKGMNIRIIETLVHGNANPREIEEFLSSSGFNNVGIEIIDFSPRTYSHYAYLDIHSDDIFICSAWWDAHIVDKLPLKKKFIYLIQDFEPIFYNNSDRYALSEATYNSKNFVALCNTKLMYDFMVNRNYHSVENGEWFEPAVAKKVTKIEKKANKKIFLYARPNVDRNLYATALGALDYVFYHNYLDGEDWEICMAGQDNLPDIQLTSGLVIKNYGKMSMDKYIKLMGEIDIAVSPMMAPHPNYPTLEFAAAGSMVVTTKYDVKQSLSNYSENIILCDISVESMAGAIKKAAETKLPNSTKSKPNIGKNWREALDSPVVKVLEKI